MPSDIPTPGRPLVGALRQAGRIGSSTPFQILANYYQTGDTRDRDLWREYSRVTRGVAAVRRSPGLRVGSLIWLAGLEVALLAAAEHGFPAGDRVASSGDQLWLSGLR